MCLCHLLKILPSQVFWRVEGPNPGMEFADIDNDTLQGTLTLLSGQTYARILISCIPLLFSSILPSPAQLLGLVPLTS